jgi:hypothetical protein
MNGRIWTRYSRLATQRNETADKETAVERLQAALSNLADFMAPVNRGKALERANTAYGNKSSGGFNDFGSRGWGNPDIRPRNNGDPFTRMRLIVRRRNEIPVDLYKAWLRLGK